MKIGLVLSNSPTYSETFFLSKIKGLQASEFEVTLFVQKTNSNFNLCDVKIAPQIHKSKPWVMLFKMSVVLLKFILQYPKRFFNYFKLERQAKRTVKQILKNLYTNNHLLQSDMDWLHFGFATIAVQSEHVANAIGAKMAVSFRGFDIDVYPKTHVGCYDLLWKHVDRVHSISNYLLERAYQLGLPPNVSFEVINPAIDVSRFSVSNPNIAGMHNPVRILTVARLHSIKSLDEIIRSLAIVKQTGISFQYSIVGEGEEREALTRQIRTLQLKEDVLLLGKRSPAEVIELMKQSDIYIQYSESEGFCNAVLEAQAMRLLCIVSDGGGLPENVIDQVTGWVVPKKNPELLAKAIQKMIFLPSKAQQKLKDAAEKRVMRDFNIDLQNQLFKDFYMTM